MEKKTLSYSLRIDRLCLERFRYIAQFEGRSINKELEKCIRKRIKDFEALYGNIDINDIIQELNKKI